MVSNTQALSDRVVLVAADDVPPGQVIQVVVNGHALALYNVDGVFYASDDRCNHGNANLSDGYLDGDVIECPLHGGCFKVVDGSPCSPPVTQPMKTYSVAVEDGQVVLINPEQLGIGQ